MGYRNVSFLAEEENGVSTSVSDTLLFATMCIIGLPVDVHAKDGSIYSGIFHTACLEDAYAVVLKKARVVKKGNRETNVADGKLIDTLIVLSEDLVQVVAKELLLPAEGISGKVGTEDVGAMADIIPQDVCEEREVDATNPKEPNMDDKHINGTRFLDPIQNCFPNGSAQNNFLEVAMGKSDGQNFVKKAEASTVSSNGRQVGDSSEEKQGSFREDPILQTEQTTDEVEGSRSSLDACRSKSSATENMNAGTNKEERANCVPFERSTVAKFDDPSHERHTVEENQQSVALSSSVSAEATSVAHVASDFSLSSSSASSKAVLPQNANYSRPAKVSKLNPRARLFSPSPVLHRSATPPAVPSPPSMTHTPEPSPVVPIATPEPEVDMSSFAYRSSVPAKFPPQNNLFLGNGRSELHYVQPATIITAGRKGIRLIIGHVGSRTPPVRFAGQYNHLQAAHGYVHPTMENVMAGRVGPLVYVHPTSNDVTQATAGYSQPSLRPLLTQHQVNLLKHQGTATMQALQLYASPPFMANGQQPFPTQSFIPISPPLFPVVASIPVPGSDGSLGTKFA